MQLLYWVPAGYKWSQLYRYLLSGEMRGRGREGDQEGERGREREGGRGIEREGGESRRKKRSREGGRSVEREGGGSRRGRGDR